MIKDDSSLPDLRRVIRPRPPRAELFFPSGITEPVKRNRAKEDDQGKFESVSNGKNFLQKGKDFENSHEWIL